MITARDSPRSLTRPASQGRPASAAVPPAASRPAVAPRSVIPAATSRGATAAHAAVAVHADATGASRITLLRSDGPLALRATWEGVYLVGAAAGPLGGDDLRLDIDVGPGASLVLRSAAAMVLLPGPDGAVSRLRVHASVGAGGSLDYAPQPTVAAAGSNHHACAEVELAPGATARWREELVLGRHGERSGRCASRLDVTVDGVPLYRGELSVGHPETDASSAVLGGARAAGSVLLANAPNPRPPAFAADGLSLLPLAGPAVVISATASDAATLCQRLDHGERLVGQSPRP